MTYSPHTPADRERMAQAIGINSTSDLFQSIPGELRAAPLNLPPALTELELQRTFATLARKNVHADGAAMFVGAGAYFHYIPAAVGALSSRGEFLTSYTPYQPEVSQGTLQAMYEFQSMVCALMGMEGANASVYDGATALVEATTMARNITGRDTVVVPAAVHPHYLSTLRAYGVPLRLLSAPLDGRLTLSPSDLEHVLDKDVAALVVPSPNLFGALEQWSDLFDMAHKVRAMSIAVASPIALGLIESPGTLGADIAVAEGQPLGINPSFGGPALGLMATKAQHLRHLPGRIVGRATDRDGRHGYVLTLRAREQDIRRERAASNICTNQSLMALQAAIYMSLLGKEGLREVATVCTQRAHYAARQIAQLRGYSVSSAPFFHEFVVTCPRPANAVVDALLNDGIVAGVPLGQWFPERDRQLLVCVTEMNERAEIDRLVDGLGALS